ncbi:MAG TPA: FAD-dependent oxidoreductase [Longimicrobiaceae bacterium]|nr:FAD-dependent oxidoreductase [Longimicrobiaceae bacterium]
MSTEAGELKGPDLTRGVPVRELEDGGVLLGHAGGEPVLLARRSDEVWAIGATCTHYGGPLAEGLVVGDTVRCPWHHACFSLRTGEALAAPALDPVPCWTVERRGDVVRVAGRREQPAVPPAPPADAPERLAGLRSVVVLGAGAAGAAAAEMLRRQGFAGRVILVGAEDEVPYDRPNLSKDYLAGSASEEWIPLRSRDFYAQNGIELALGVPAVEIDTRGRRVVLADGSAHGYDALLLATGAEPVRPDVPGADLPHVHYLRTLADSRALIAGAEKAGRAVVLGAGFIGLEAAASLRARGLEVQVVAPGERPLGRVMGLELGDFVRALHEEHGVVFHLGRTAREILADAVVLDDGRSLPAELVVAGIGVRPLDGLAGRAGIAVERGVLVDEHLETSVPGVFAAGDVARYPDPRFGGRIRVEHWVAAQRQGQAAARNLLGRREPFRDVPFFWSRHYDVAIAYVGHAEQWDRIDLDGSPEERDCTAVFRAGGETLAVATVFRDRESLRAEVAMERGDRAALARLAGPALSAGGAR